MKSVIRLSLCCSFFMFFQNTLAQQKTGEIFTPSQLEDVEIKAFPFTKSELPEDASLKSFCPPVFAQAGGTCFAYASAYAGRSVLYNATHNNTSVDQKRVFSPGYVVRQLQPKRTFGNPRCSKGSSTINACKLMARTGVVPLNVFQEECSRRDITDEMRTTANQYRIVIKSLFNPCDDVLRKVYQIQEALSNGHPVVVGLTTTNSFMNNRNGEIADLWIPTSNELAQANCNTANHAVCIVGYHGTKYGGVFEIMNSWGDDWKNGGFTYVKYQDLAKFLSFAIELSN